MFPSAYFAPSYFTSSYFERASAVTPPVPAGGGSRQRPAIRPISARLELRLPGLQFSVVGVVSPAPIRAAAGLVLAATSLGATATVQSADIAVAADWTLGGLGVRARGTASRLGRAKSDRHDEDELFELYGFSTKDRS